VIFLAGSKAKTGRHKNRQATPIKMRRKTEDEGTGQLLMSIPGLVQLGLSLASSHTSRKGKKCQ
jgi:hypothetical protein